jgi:hypothetical protein
VSSAAQSHEGLGIPEGVPIVAGAGQALGAYRTSLRTGTGLQDVEERKPQRLLNLHVAVELDVGHRPVVVQVLALGRREPVEALGDRRLEARIDLIAQPFDRLLRGPVVGEQLHHAQRPTGSQLRRDGHAAEVILALGP